MDIFGADHVWGEGEGQKSLPPLNLSQIPNNNETWHSYTLPKEDAKNIWITWHAPLVLLTAAFFNQKSVTFLYIKKYR